MNIKYVTMGFVIVAIFVFILKFESSDFGEGITGEIVRVCSDTDGGIVGSVRGTVLGYEDPYKAKTDFCINRTTVGEYYCRDDKSDGAIEEVYCGAGCSNGRCLDVVVADTEVKCEQGCLQLDKCVPVGTRVRGKYCHWDGSWKVQIEGRCENSYECKSNFCVANRCLEEEEWDNFLEDIKETHFWE